MMTEKWVDFFAKIDLCSKFGYIISKIGKSPPKSSSSFPNRDPLLQNLPLTFDRMYCSQKLGEDFAKFLWPSQNIWTLIFLTFFEKKYNNWIKFKLPKSRIKWTGLLSPVHPNYNRSFLIWSKFQGLAQKLKDQPFAAAAKNFKSGIPFKKSFLDFWLFLDPASLINRNLLDTI